MYCRIFKYILPLFLLIQICLFGPDGVRASARFLQMRRSMVVLQIEGRGIRDKLVLDAMSKVPRHEFVHPRLSGRAYEDTPLPIGYGQTISQPYIVALMTELLGLSGKSKVLEVGTGSGYQAAVLSRIAGRVYTMEIIRPLYTRSSAVFKKLGYANIRSLHGDGYYGWKEKAPYDGIIVTCASELIPPPLVKQLKTGGLMCIPVGPPFKVQHLLLVKKGRDGKIRSRVVASVRFVPLVRGEERD